MGGGAWRAASKRVTAEASAVVRPAVEDDLAEVVRIERASFADPWTRNSLASTLSLERMRFLVAEGSVGSSGARDGEQSLWGYVIALDLVDEAELVNLAVDPAARRRGVGGLLLDWVTRDVVDRGVKALYLEVRESNAAARSLYTSRSFVQVGRRRAYYQHPCEDALLLRWEYST